MDSSTPKLLLTGPPGCGKTTLIRRIVQRLEKPVNGFYTEEVRGAHGKRIGFDAVTLDGSRGPLARTDIQGPRVGRYGVDLHFLEKTALCSMEPGQDAIIVIDEIGKMECFSHLFVETVRGLLGGPTTILGTVALGGSPFIREVRCHPKVELVEVTVKNRDGLVEEIIDRLRIAD